jgi:hypothetical protein
MLLLHPKFVPDVATDIKLHLKLNNTARGYSYLIFGWSLFGIPAKTDYPYFCVL